MASRRFQQPTGFQVEFWTAASGKDRKHRKRYYTTAEGMIRAGARWEAKGRDYWCRYWNDLNTWESATRPKLPLSKLPLGRHHHGDSGKPCPGGPKCPAQVVPLAPERVRRRRPASMQTFSVFGVCEATAAEIMLKDGRATRKIPVDEIPESALYNQFGNKALFAIMVPGERVPEFEKLCKELRA